MKNESTSTLQDTVKPSRYYHNVTIYSSLEVADWSFPEVAEKPTITVKYSPYKPYHRNISYEPLDIKGFKNQHDIDEYINLLTFQNQLEQDFSFTIKAEALRIPTKNKIELIVLSLYIPISFKDSTERMYKLLVGLDQVKAYEISVKTYIKQVGVYSIESMILSQMILEDGADNIDDISKVIIIRLMLFAEKLAIDILSEHDPEMFRGYKKYFEKNLNLLKKYNKESLANNYPPDIFKDNENGFSIEEFKGMFFYAINSFTNSCSKVFVSSEKGSIEEKEPINAPLRQEEMVRDAVLGSDLRRRSHRVI